MQDIEPTAAEMIAALLENTGTSTMKAASKSITVRFPIQLLCELDAMAKVANKSRSVMLFHIVQIGLNEVMKVTNDEAKKRVSALAFENMEELVESLDLDSENLEG
jgi:metal-responsive CopG/Arc/MetJ family transcriptional regulator